MADQSSIFNNTNGDTPPNNDQGIANPGVPNEDQLNTLLLEIKNERGEPKYKNVQEALIGLKNAQEYIPTLKTQLTAKEIELENLRKEKERIEELERTVKELTSSRQVDEPTNSNPITKEVIADLVNRTLTEREKAVIQKSNIEGVVAAMSQAFGENAEKKFYEKATELGFTVQEFNNLAAQKPKAVLDILGVKSNPVTQKPGAPNAGTINTLPLSDINKETFVTRNTKQTSIGATSQELMEESNNARKMVEELHKQGMSVHDLTDPKVFFKQFNK